MVGRRRILQLSIEECEELFHLPVELAANRLGVSRPTIARVMRAHGYARWPFRVVRAHIRQHSDPRPSQSATQVTVPKRPISSGTVCTNLGVSDAIAIARRRNRNVKSMHIGMSL